MVSGVRRARLRPETAHAAERAFVSQQELEVTLDPVSELCQMPLEIWRNTVIYRGTARHIVVAGTGRGRMLSCGSVRARRSSSTSKTTSSKMSAKSILVFDVIGGDIRKGPQA